jgi:hypothetical protein
VSGFEGAADQVDEGLLVGTDGVCEFGLMVEIMDLELAGGGIEETAFVQLGNVGLVGEVDGAGGGVEVDAADLVFEQREEMAEEDGTGAVTDEVEFEGLTGLSEFGGGVLEGGSG